MDENTSGISGEIQKMILDKLNTFNRGKTSDKGRYYILLPTSKTLYYTLWFFTPSATYHPTVYLANLDLNAISSVNKAIKMVSNSFLPLFITTDIKDSPDNGDDIIVGTPGEKLSDLKLTITKVRIEDDSYKTQIIRGTEYFYVDQLLTAVDIAGNYFLLRIKAKDRSLTTQTLPPGAHAFQVGEKLTLTSAKVLKHIESRTIKYTRIGYIKIQ